MQTDAERALIERWILAFCETPPIVDPELMERLLAHHEAKTRGPGDDRQDVQGG